MLFPRYFFPTRRFYYSIFFILPFLVIYEIGLGRGVLGENINGADAILRLFFYFLSNILGQTITSILVALVIVGLAAFLVYYLITFKIKIQWHFFLVMLFEAALWALGIGILLHLGLNSRLPRFFTFAPSHAVMAQLALVGLSSGWSKIVASIGAGIFEEFLFRVVLLRFLYTFWSRQRIGGFGTDQSALVRATLLSSLIFTLLHLGSVASAFGLISIFLGSVIFSFVYIKRGYGITAVTHILYDAYLMFGIIA